MASKGPRSRLDHDTRAKRQKALEAPKEPRRPKTHWDHVLEEMVWLSKDFESERKWKLGQAKKVAVRASKCMLDQATKGERKVKEEEQRLRKLALNISKEMKRFWTKIEKLVLYKHQLELEERKKKALDKQLDFLLGQTERYSTMLAENLVDIHHSDERVPQGFRIDQPSQHDRMANPDTKHASEPQYNSAEVDKDYSVRSEDESEDDEHTMEEDEALVTEEEQKEELTALQNEADLPLEELLQRYSNPIVSRDAIPVSAEGVADDKKGGDHIKDSISPENYSQCIDNHTNGVSAHVDKDDASHVMKLDSLHGQEHKTSATDISGTHNNEELEGDNKSFGEKLTIKELQSRSHSKHLSSLDKDDLPLNSSDEMDDHDYILVADEEKDDETTLLEEEELAMKEANDPLDEIKLLQQDSEMPIEELIARYKKDAYSDDNGSEDQSDFASLDSDDQCSSPVDDDIQHGTPYISEDGDESNQHKSVELEQNHTKKEICMDIDKKLDEEIGTENIIADAAAAARSAQPTGNTFSTTKVRTKFPFLLKFPLREYQHIGLDWLVTMYEKRLNGILADEMGLGKTIMTISLLAHLACEKGIWGPHLIVVPTSVMLNWETEFLKWCPAFKILTYYGSAKERKHKRQGWLKPNSFHICITTYRLVIQDSKVFKRKKWKYLILDEAHLIKNWKSQRWQTLLNFNSKRRILLTGTPLQNDLMELWSLMHFLMPHIFQSHQEFKDWFSNPITGMVEGQEKVNKDVVDRLHNVLRPFILRRLKRDVEKQLPKKHEHVIYCRLSKRQRNLYEDFIASSETQATLASGNFFGMISVIMQLRKVCNHPDLFEGRPIISSFDMAGIDMQLSTSACSALSTAPFSNVDLKGLNIIFTQFDFDMTSWEIDEVREIYPLSSYFVDSGSVISDGREPCSRIFDKRKIHGSSIFEEIQKDIFEERVRQAKERADAIAWWNSLRCQKKPVYGTNLRALLSIKHPVFDIHEQKNNPSLYMNFSSKLADVVLLPVERFQRVLDLVECFMFAIPAARAPSPVCWCSKADLPVFLKPAYKEECTKAFCPLLMPIRPAIVRRQVYFPDRCLIQFDCGKLQELAVLLRRLKSEGHRALIFTQMTKMLDILEAFINLYGYTYMRLDGSTQPEERQTLMQRFNTNPKYFLFILSTRSGGVGINLVGADTVVFYDSDWNPAMDQQAQDRCHRIGQTREVHIYRLISESTIEENILKKANQKRALDDLVIQSGSYNTDFFKKLDPMELFSSHRTPHEEDQNADSSTVEGCNHGVEVLSHADVEAALKQAEDEADYMALKKVEEEEAVENQEFTEEAIGRLEDDDLVNDEDAKLDDVATEEQGFTSILSKDSGVSSHDTKICEDKPLTLTERDEDIDMLADVKQMAAAAAAAGQASSSFENQLRPVDRYAMRFLNLWDPIIDKSEIDSDLGSEEEEWELDRIQKFKDELEAEIDEDEEPLVYETWDADFATEAYKQHVEALAQQQLLEELESESLERDYADDGNTDAIRKEGPRERKTKKKSKKTKFKSLKKGSLTSEKEVAHDELKLDPDTDEYKILSLEDIPLDSPSTKKKRRIAAPEERASRKQLKKLKKPPECIPAVDSETPDKHLSEIKEFKSVDGMGDIDPKPASRSKMGGKISITVMPVKRVMVVKPEKFKKKGNIWSKECTPSPDSWSSQEDAILCAVVHEYGTHWSLVSNVLYGMPAGGFYRGRFRHPVHCCDRFRELFFRYILSSPESPNADKINAHSSGKALLKVTEDHVHMLLNTASELPDTELLLQKHFTALLSSVWRVKCRQERHQNVPCSRTASGIRSRRLTERMHPTVLRQSGKVVATALEDAFRDRIYQEESPIPSSQSVKSPEANVEVTLPKELVEFLSSFASVVRFSINSSDPLRSTDQPQEQDLLSRTSYRTAEQRFRLAWETCLEGESPGWASSAFPAPGSGRSRAGSKSQSLGKHKSLSDSAKPLKSKVPRITASEMEDSSLVNQFLSMAGCNFSDSGECLDPSFRLDASKDDDYQLLPVGTHIPMDYDVELLQYDHDPGVTVGLELASFDFEELEPLDDTMEFG